MLQREYKIIIQNIIGEICLVMDIDFCNHMNQADSISLHGRNQEVSIITIIKVRGITLMDDSFMYLPKCCMSHAHVIFQTVHPIK